MREKAQFFEVHTTKEIKGGLEVIGKNGEKGTFLKGGEAPKIGNTVKVGYDRKVIKIIPSKETISVSALRNTSSVSRETEGIKTPSKIRKDHFLPQFGRA